MKKVVFLIAVFAFFIVGFQTVYASRVNEISQYFEDSKSISDLTARWYVPPSTDFNVEIVQFPNTKNKCLKMDTTGVGTPMVQFQPGAYINEFVFEGCYYFNDTSCSKYVQFRAGNNKVAVFLEFSPNGKIYAFQNSETPKKEIADYKVNEWIQIAFSFNTYEKKYTVYLNGKNVASNFELPAFDMSGSDMDYTKGINALRFSVTQQNVDSVCYIDNFMVYPGKIKADDERITGETAEEKLKGAVALLPNANNVLADYKKIAIDEKDKTITPFITDDVVYIPLKFICNIFNINTYYQAENGFIVVKAPSGEYDLTSDSAIAMLNGKEYALNAPVKTVNGKAYVSLIDIGKIINKNTFHYDNGLIVISPRKEVFRPKAEGDLLDDVKHTLMFERPKAEQLLSDLKNSPMYNVHPRLFLNQSRFEEIKEIVKKDPKAKKWVDQLKADADLLMKESTVTYTFEVLGGGGLLPMIQKLEKRVSCLALLYNITGEEKYAERAWQEMKAAAEFPDWAPASFLNPSQAGYSLSLGYDWLYNWLSEDKREIIRKAIYEKALLPAIDGYNGKKVEGSTNSNWPNYKNNWSPICNGSLCIMALAIGDESNEAVIGEILEKSLRHYESYLPLFAPDGGYEEGLTYWEGTIEYMAKTIAALDSVMNNDYGYFNVEGVDKTVYYGVSQTGPITNFRYGDVGNRKYIETPVLYWFAQKLNNYDIAAYRNYSLENGSTLSPYDLVWYNPDKIPNKMSSLSKDLYFSNIETITMRSMWNNNDAFFAGFHTGSNLASHGNLDMGTFNYSAWGELWFPTLPVEYYSLPGLFDTAPIVGGRWKYYAKRAEGQNTLVINPGELADQISFANGYIKKIESKPSGAFAIADITEAYANDADIAKRGVMLFDNRSKLLVQDEVKLKKKGQIWWFAHTGAKVEIGNDKRSAILTIGNKKLGAYILTPSKAYFKLMNAEPLETSPNPPNQKSRKEYRKLAINFENVEKLSLSVVFVPITEDNVSRSDLPKPIPMDTWKIADGEIECVNNIKLDGIPIKNFEKENFYYTEELSRKYEKPPIITADSEKNVVIVQGNSIPSYGSVKVLDSVGNVKTTYNILFTRAIEIANDDMKGKIQIQSAEASSYQNADTLPANSFDNNLSTRWAAQGKNEWITYDLGSEYTISDVAIAWLSGNSRKSYFDIAVSCDNKKFDVVWNGESSGKTTDREVFSVKPVKARYVKILCHGNSESEWNSLCEINVYQKNE